MPEPVLDLHALIRDIVRQELKSMSESSAAAGEFLSTAEAAALARVSPDTLRRWVKDGRLTPGHAGRELRFRRADIQGLMSSSSGRARAPRRGVVDTRTPEARAAAAWGSKRAR